MQNQILAKEHLYINQVRETVELTNVVKIPSFSIFNKNRFAVLTTQRLLIFDDKEAFLLKKACKVIINILFLIQLFYYVRISMKSKEMIFI